jgi:phenylacetate-CoA ligase
MTVVRTGGSTGRRLEIACTAVALAVREAFGLRDHLWHRRDLSAKLAVIAAEEARRAGWGASAGAAYETGPCVTLDIACGIAVQAAWLAREDPDYLLTTAGNAAKLAQHFTQHGVRLARLREVRTTGAPPSAAMRPAWPVPMSDVYSAAEAGCLALRCPEQGRYHLQAEGVLVEIVDERGRPCPAGDVGRVVVTPLHNFATVLLRYDIGDEAAVAEPCRCGRGLPAIAGIARRAAPEAAEAG